MLTLKVPQLLQKSSNQNGSIKLSTNYTSKYDNFRTNELRGDALTKYNYIKIAEGRWISPDTLVSSTNKTDCHDITEILLKVALNIIRPLLPMKVKYCRSSGLILYCTETTINRVGENGLTASLVSLYNYRFIFWYHLDYSIPPLSNFKIWKFNDLEWRNITDSGRRICLSYEKKM